MLDINTNTFLNSNGIVYDVIAVDLYKERAILRAKNRATWDNGYMVAKFFRANQSSWGQGVYDLTIGEAYQEFNKF